MTDERLEYRLRSALRADALQIAHLYHQGWQDAHAKIVPVTLLPDRMVNTFEAKVPGMLQRCVVAEDKAGLIGFVAWNGSELGQLFINPKLQGRGIASALLKTAELRMREHGVGEAFLTCVIGNQRARSFYLRRGWLEAAEEDYAARVRDEIVLVPVWRMTKQLGG